MARGIVKRVLIAALVAGVLVAGGAATWLWLDWRRPYKGYDAGEQFVDIPIGAGPAAIGPRLVEAGVVRNDIVFRLEVGRSRAGRRLKAGEYRFDQPMTVSEVVAKRARGDVYLRPITFPEGLTIRQMAQIYESRGFGRAAEFVAA